MIDRLPNETATDYAAAQERAATVRRVFDELFGPTELTARELALSVPGPDATLAELNAYAGEDLPSIALLEHFEAEHRDDDSNDGPYECCAAVAAGEGWQGHERAYPTILEWLRVHVVASAELLPLPQAKRLRSRIRAQLRVCSRRHDHAADRQPTRVLRRRTRHARVAMSGEGNEPPP